MVAQDAGLGFGGLPPGSSRSEQECAVIGRFSVLKSLHFDWLVRLPDLTDNYGSISLNDSRS